MKIRRIYNYVSDILNNKSITNNGRQKQSIESIRNDWKLKKGKAKINLVQQYTDETIINNRIEHLKNFKDLNYLCK